ncbi:hypothetical protein R3P38DRAFT_3181988 [Favolaschia claudopus]|uniref:Uncharacterized protein n=1 Tax=Favolaschia claudopus TaxID=2862362 RepID=A0AAW0CFN0_9AGAR
MSIVSLLNMWILRWLPSVRSYLCIAKLSVLIVILVAAPSAVQAIKTHRFNPDGGLQHKSVAFTFRRLTRADSGTLSAQDLRIRTLLAQYMIVHALSLFDLSYGDIKLMQAATDTRISGSVVAALFHGGFEPNDLDFYCAHGSADDVVSYMREVCSYHLVFDSNRDYDDVFGIRRVLTMRNSAGKRINVVETYSDYPVDVILGFHSTPPRGCISWDRFSHFEINRLRKGVALATPTSMRLAGNVLDGQVQMWRILHKYTDRGFVFEYDHPIPHQCGVDIDCPATVRTVDDAGCLHIDLLPCSVPDVTRPQPPLFTWSLAPVGICDSGRIGDVPVHNIYSYQYRMFRRLAAALLKMPIPPVNLLEISPWDDTDYYFSGYDGSEEESEEV